jgi:hypothetical protein
LALIGFAFSPNPGFQAKNEENWVCLAPMGTPPPGVPSNGPELASIGFVFAADLRFYARNEGNWVCLAPLMTADRAVPARRLSIADRVLGNGRVGLNWI